MKFSNYNDFIKDFSLSNLSNLYFLNCAQSYIIEDFIGTILKLIDVDQSEPFNFYNFNQEKLNIEKLEDCLESLPFMKEKKAVLVKNLEIDKMSGSDFDKMKILIDCMPVTVVFIYINSNLENKPTLKLKQIIKIFEKNGAFIDINLNDKNYIYKILEKTAKANGCRISKNFGFKLIDKLGYNLDNLIIELDKICNFSDTEDLKEQDLDFILEKNKVHSSFDLAKVIFNKDLNKSLDILKNLFNNNTDPILILNGINIYFTDLYICRFAYDSNQTVDEILKEFDYKGKEFRIKNGYRDCKKNSLEYLTKCIDILMDIDLKLKTCKINSRILMEKAIIEMVSGN